MTAFLAELGTRVADRTVLATLAANLSALFEQTGERALIAEAAQLRREAVGGTAPTHIHTGA